MTNNKIHTYTQQIQKKDTQKKTKSKIKTQIRCRKVSTKKKEPGLKEKRIH